MRLREVLDIFEVAGFRGGLWIHINEKIKL